MEEERVDSPVLTCSQEPPEWGDGGRKTIGKSSNLIARIKPEKKILRNSSKYLSYLLLPRYDDDDSEEAQSRCVEVLNKMTLDG